MSIHKKYIIKMNSIELLSMDGYYLIICKHIYEIL